VRHRRGEGTRERREEKGREGKRREEKGLKRRGRK
jgi:hypothetical protein